MTLMRFMILIHCFHFQNWTLSSFSEWNVLMDKSSPRHQVWRFFQVSVTTHLSCCVNSKQRFSIIGVQSYLSKYFCFTLSSFPSDLFCSITKNFRTILFYMLPAFTSHCSLFWSLHKKTGSFIKKTFRNFRANKLDDSVD